MLKTQNVKTILKNKEMLNTKFRVMVTVYEGGRDTGEKDVWVCVAIKSDVVLGFHLGAQKEQPGRDQCNYVMSQGAWLVQL